MTLIFSSDLVLPISIFPRSLLRSTDLPTKLPVFKFLVALKAIVAAGAVMESTIILLSAFRLTVGMMGLTGFVATGLTVIARVLMSCPATILISPEVAISPVATLPVLLLALTLAALRLPTLKSLEAVKLIFSLTAVIALVLMSCPARITTSPEVAIAPVTTLPVMLVALLTLAALRLPTVKSLKDLKLIFSLAVILTGAVLKTIIFGSLKTPSSPELLTISTLEPCKFPKFTSPKALSSIAPEVPVSIDLVSILPPPVIRLILPLISAREMSFVNIILLRASISIVELDINLPPTITDPSLLSISIRPPLISLVRIFPSADKITGPPAEILSTEIKLFDNDESINIASSPKPSVPGLAGFSRFTNPARRIKAGLLLKVAISGSSLRFSLPNAISGPVIVISSATILPFASTFSETPV